MEHHTLRHMKISTANNQQNAVYSFFIATLSLATIKHRNTVAATLLL